MNRYMMLALMLGLGALLPVTGLAQASSSQNSQPQPEQLIASTGGAVNGNYANAHNSSPKSSPKVKYGFVRPGFGITWTLGFSSKHTKNTTTHLQTVLDFGWKTGRWSTSFKLRAIASWHNGDAQSKEYFARGQGNYSLTRKSYVWARAAYRYNEFTEFQYQSAEIVGYGYKPIDNRKRILRLEVGVGAGQDKTRDGGVYSSGVAEMAREVYAQHFGFTGRAYFAQELYFVRYPNNTYSEFAIRFVQPIAKHWKFWVGYRLEHNSQSITPDSVQTSSWITLNLSYHFGTPQVGT